MVHPFTWLVSCQIAMTLNSYSFHPKKTVILEMNLDKHLVFLGWRESYLIVYS